MQSQTWFPSTVSIAVDTSDLPTSPETTSQAPPSYFTAIASPRPTQTTLHSQSSYVSIGEEQSVQTDFTPQIASTDTGVSVYLPEEDANG